jgi:transcriptional regulator with XRE-family HTH domain
VLHISHNIKIIRKIYGLTQPDFVRNFTKVTVAMQKSYESGKAEPGTLYIQELSELTGISEKDLRSKKLIKSDLSKVEKGEKGENAKAENTGKNGLVNITADRDKLIIEQQKEIIRLKAKVNVILITLADVVSKVDKKVIALVDVELTEAINRETKVLLDEFEK